MATPAHGVDAAGPPDGDDPDHFVSAVLAASWLLVGISTRSVEDVDERVTLTQFRTLAVLADRGQTNLSRLAAELDVNASTAMRVIDRLVATNLVSRTENPATRREVVLCLTPAGEQLVDEVVAKRREVIAGLVNAIPANDRAALVACLRLFTAVAEQAGLRPAAPASLGW
ncbi:MAG TPA: MarR family transcriptional regulator [Mycobacteriales bacterium]|nr:MarR family transcriptional regulator [Mycobacteriales bacterium]